MEIIHSSFFVFGLYVYLSLLNYCGLAVEIRYLEGYLIHRYSFSQIVFRYSQPILLEQEEIWEQLLGLSILVMDQIEVAYFDNQSLIYRLYASRPNILSGLL